MSAASLRALLPGCVQVSERHHDEDPESLYPEEVAHLSRAVDKRRREFATVRRCARDALARLGIDRPPMVPGAAGSPTWPDGVVGSMTHCQGYRAAAVASAAEIHGVGIDAEPNESLPAGVLRTIALPAEMERVRLLAAVCPGTAWDRLLFSAKESVYKTWYPLAHEWLGFEEADITIEPSGRFRASLSRSLALPARRVTRELSGRWVSDQNHVLTSVVVAACGGASCQDPVASVR